MGAVTGMKRLYADRFTASFEEVTRYPWCYTTASIIAEKLVEQKPQRLNIVSNKFKSLVSFNTVNLHACTLHEAQTMDRAEWSKAVDTFSFEPSVYEVWEDL